MPELVPISAPITEKGAITLAVTPRFMVYFSQYADAKLLIWQWRGLRAPQAPAATGVFLISAQDFLVGDARGIVAKRG
jgi:hypothetical protein